MSLANHAVLSSIEGRFLDFLESVPDAMVLSDHEGRIVLVNSHAERLFGYPRDELVDNKSRNPDADSVSHSPSATPRRLLCRPQYKTYGTSRSSVGSS